MNYKSKIKIKSFLQSFSQDLHTTFPQGPKYANKTQIIIFLLNLSCIQFNYKTITIGLKIKL